MYPATRFKNFDLKVHVSNHILNEEDEPLLISEMTYLLQNMNFIELVRTYYDEDDLDSVITTIEEIKKRIEGLIMVTYKVDVTLITNPREVEVLLRKVG